MGELFVIDVGGKQYSVGVGDRVCVDLDKTRVNIGDRIDVACIVRMAKQDDGVVASLDTFTSENSKGIVGLQILSHAQGDKVTAFKYKRRKGFHKKTGHRQKFFVAEVVQ